MRKSSASLEALTSPPVLPTLLSATTDSAWRSSVFPIVSDAIIYADQPATRILAWSCPGGVSGLLDAGAWTVRALEEELDEGFSSDTSPHRNEGTTLRLPDPPKVVFFCSRPLTDVAAAIKAVVTSRPYDHVCVLAGIPQSLQNFENKTAAAELFSDDDILSDDGGIQDITNFEAWEKRLKSWMRTGQEKQPFSETTTLRFPIATVLRAPLLYAMLTPNLFVLPSCADVFPMLDKGAMPHDNPEVLNSPASGRPKSAGVTFPPHTRRQFRRVSVALAATLESLGGKIELFAMGESAKYIARQIHTLLPSPRLPDKIISVVLVDRTFDLVAPTMHADGLADQIYTVLPRIAPSSPDIAVSSNNIISNLKSADAEKTFSLAHGMDPRTVAFFKEISSTNLKDGLVAVRKCLMDIISSESLNFKLPKIMGKVTFNQLAKFVDALKEGGEPLLLRNGNLLPWCLATVQALQESGKQMWDELLGVEKILSLSVAETGNASNVVEQIMDLLPKSTTGTDGATTVTGAGFSLPSILLLACFSYSLIGTDLSFTEEHKSKLLDQFMRTAASVSHSTEGKGEKSDEKAEEGLGSDEEGLDRLRQRRICTGKWIVECFDTLAKIAGARKGLTRYKTLYRSNTNPPYISLTKQLFTDILGSGGGSPSSSSPLGKSFNGLESEDLQYVPAGGTLGNVLTGFSRFLKHAGPHPAHGSTIVYFVVGGITFAEARDIADVQALNGVANEIIVGGTDIATGTSMYPHLFKSSDATQDYNWTP